MVSEALGLLKSGHFPLDRTCICFNAVGQLLEKHFVHKGPALMDNISHRYPGVRFFFTSRWYIGVEIEKYFPRAVRFLRIKGTRQEITRYFEKILDDDLNPEAMNAGLRVEIINQGSETISNVYVPADFHSRPASLLVSPRFLLSLLNIAEILYGTTIHDWREQPNRMTNV